MTRVYQIKGYYIRQRLDYKTANGVLNTLNPKLSYIDTVLIIFQTVRWYGGTGGSRVGHGGVTGGSRGGHGWVTGGVTWTRRAAVTEVGVRSVIIKRSWKPKKGINYYFFLIG